MMHGMMDNPKDGKSMMEKPSASTYGKGGDFDKRCCKLRESVRWSSEEMKPHRQKYLEVNREYVGHHWKNGARDRVPLNLINLYVNIFLRNLAASTPVPLISATAKSLKERAWKLQLSGKHLLEELQFSKVRRQIVYDALVSAGYAKVDIAFHGTAMIEGLYHDRYRPYVKRVSPDDIRLDLHARHWDEQYFIGDTYRVNLAAAQDYKGWRKQGRESLKADDSASSGKVDSDSGGDNRTETLGRNLPGGEGRGNEETLEVQDLYLPYENWKMTFPVKGEWKKETCLFSGEWEGPERGPYRRHTFSEVPDNVLGLGPALGWLDMHTFVNQCYNKLQRQALRQKNHTFYLPAAWNDAQSFIDYPDGMSIKTNSPESVSEKRWGGPDQVNFAFLLQALQLANKHAGNPDALGGLAPSADTLGQEEMIAGSSSRQLAEMHDRDVEFTADLMKTLFWYEWHDPQQQRRMLYTYPGTDLTTEVVYSPEEREGDFYDLNISIEPYSMKHENPAQRIAAINGLIDMLAKVQQLGGAVNIDNAVRLYARYANMTDLEDLFTGQMPPPPNLDESGPKMPSATSRTYTRKDAGGGNDPMNDMIGKMLTGAGQRASA